MPDKRYRPRTADRVGAEPLCVQSNVATTLTASGTTLLLLPVLLRTQWIERLAFAVGSTPPAFSTLTITFNKRRGAATTALSAATVINGLTQYTVVNIPLLATLTDVQRTLTEGDILEASIAAGTLTTQPAGGVSAVAELLYLY